MRRPRGACHECCPADWRQTTNITGSYELDAAIMKNKNKDVPDRLKMFVDNDTAYGPSTAYNGYHNYGKDS